MSGQYPQGTRMTTICGSIHMLGTELRTGAYRIYTFQRKPKYPEVEYLACARPTSGYLLPTTKPTLFIPHRLSPSDAGGLAHDSLENWI